VVRSAAEIEQVVQRVIRLAAERVPLTAAYLFGSYCDGSATDDSDSDIALFSPGADTMPPPDRTRLLTDIRLAVETEVELHLYDDKWLAQARPSNVYGHILATGRRVA